jgi:hypothetical protein
MKTFLPLKNFLSGIIVLSLINSTQAQTNFVFNSYTIVSGTALHLGAVYKFNNAVSGGYALVTIDSLVGGATVGTIDDNSSGLGYLEAFQPSVTTPGMAGGVLHEAYAVFKIDFYYNTINTPMVLQNVSGTALDIDGNATLKELAEINMNGGTASYMSSTLDLAMSVILGIKYRADNILGIERSGIDTSAYGNMFTVTKTNISSFKVKYGAKSLLSGASTRQYSLYMKGFLYPSQATLPVKLVDFSARYNKPDVNLSWKSSEEINLNYYMLEQSADGNNYSTVCLVFAAAENGRGAEYSYVDHKASQRGLVYYRLKMVDNDGKFSYSPTRIIRFETNDQLVLTTFPNPFTTDLKITLPSAWQDKLVAIDICNVKGQVVKSAMISHASQTETMNLSGLDGGIYFLKASSGGQIINQKLIKN